MWLRVARRRPGQGTGAVRRCCRRAGGHSRSGRPSPLVRRWSCRRCQSSSLLVEKRSGHLGHCLVLIASHLPVSLDPLQVLPMRRPSRQGRPACRRGIGDRSGPRAIPGHQLGAGPHRSGAVAPRAGPRVIGVHRSRTGSYKAPPVRPPVEDPSQTSIRVPVQAAATEDPLRPAIGPQRSAAGRRPPPRRSSGGRHGHPRPASRGPSRRRRGPAAQRSAPAPAAASGR
jgi:hypothetical protein